MYGASSNNFFAEESRSKYETKFIFVINVKVAEIKLLKKILLNRQVFNK